MRSLTSYYPLLLLFGLLSSPIYAITNVDIYHSEIEFNPAEADAEANARIAGMQQVIVQATGEAKERNNPAILKAARQNAQYLSQISYSSEDPRTRLKTVKMDFNPGHIRSLLTQLQLPYWPEKRENILVWLVEDDYTSRQILWADSDSSWVTSLRKAAHQRALPLTFAQGDAERISSSDLWGGFTEQIGDVSDSYSVADAVLVLRIQNNQIRWQLYDQLPRMMSASPKIPLNGVVNGDSAQSMPELVEQLVQYYVQKNAIKVKRASSQSITIKVTNVNKVNDFFMLEKRLNNMNTVSSIELLEMERNSASYRLYLQASEDELKQEFEQQGQIQWQGWRELPTPYLSTKVKAGTTEKVGLTTTTKSDSAAVSSAANSSATNSPETNSAVQTEPLTNTLLLRWNSSTQ